MEEQNEQQKAKELNRLIDTLLDKSLGVCKEAQNALAELFDLLLWAQKKYLPTLTSASECQLLAIVLQKYKQMPQYLLSGFTLLLGNAKDGGPLINHILQHRLADGVLSIFLSSLEIEANREEDEQLHLLGSFLKAYHRHLTQNTVKFFIDNGKCLLIEVCCEFFNCNEQITRTSILNILMNLLRMPWAQYLLVGRVRQRVERWARQLCCLLRNQLKDFDQNLLATEQQDGQHLVQLINDKVILWEDLSALSIIFSKPFFEEVILPLLVGSLNTSGVPLFTLKFALFILQKMLPTIASLKLIRQLSKLLFLPMQVRYSQHQLSTAILRPFNIQRLCITQLQIDEDEQYAEFGQTSQLFLNILRSKDSRFLEGGCRLVLGLVKHIRKDPSQQSFFQQQLGFSEAGHSLLTISQILLNQFSALHAIQANRIIGCLLIQMQPKKYLGENLKHRFLHLLRKQLDQCLKDAEKYKDLYSNHICQLFQYDVRAVNGEELDFQPISKTDAALLFNNNVIENQQLPFYQQIPETSRGIIRYNLIKTLLLRRLAKIIIEQYSQQGSLERYLQRARVMNLKYVKPGQYLKLPLTCNSTRCKMVDQKMQIPNCLLLEDENSLMIGYVQSLRVKMILNIKHKHTNPVFSIKKEKVYLEIAVRKYDQNRQEMIPVKGIVIKNLQAPPEYFKTKRTNAVEREYATIVDILKRSKESIPVMSLI